MSTQIENNFQSFYTVAEEIIGEEKALEIADEIGRRYGGRGYATLLEAYGTRRDGSARHDGALPGPRAQHPRSEARLRALRRARRGSLRRQARGVHLLQRGPRPRTASTPARSSPAASRATAPPTRTCCGSRSTTVAGRATPAASSTGSIRTTTPPPSSRRTRRPRRRRSPPVRRRQLRHSLHPASARRRFQRRAGLQSRPQAQCPRSRRGSRPGADATPQPPSRRRGSMRARQHRDADRVDILVDGRRGHGFGRLEEAGVDHLEPCVA